MGEPNRNLGNAFSFEGNIGVGGGFGGFSGSIDGVIGPDGKGYAIGVDRHSFTTYDSGKKAYAFELLGTSYYEFVGGGLSLSLTGPTSFALQGQVGTGFGGEINAFGLGGEAEINKHVGLSVDINWGVMANAITYGKEILSNGIAQMISKALPHQYTGLNGATLYSKEDYYNTEGWTSEPTGTVQAPTVASPESSIGADTPVSSDPGTFTSPIPVDPATAPSPVPVFPLFFQGLSTIDVLPPQTPAVITPINFRPVLPPTPPAEQPRPDNKTESPLTRSGVGSSGSRTNEDRNDRTSSWGDSVRNNPSVPRSRDDRTTSWARDSESSSTSSRGAPAGHNGYSDHGPLSGGSRGGAPVGHNGYSDHGPLSGSNRGGAPVGHNGYSDHGPLSNDRGGSKKGGGSYRGNGPGRSPTGNRGNGAIAPVLLDITGTGLDIDPISSSSKFIETNGDGYQSRTAWAGAGNGVLVIDLGGDGKVTDEREFAFTQWDASASSDLAALKSAFDTNGNGKLDAGDSRWNEFKVMVDDQLVSLSSLGIESIDLTPTGTGRIFSDGSVITGTTTFTRTDGTQGAVGDAVLAADSTSYVIKRSAVTNADGSMTTTISGFDKAGALAFRELVTLSADRATTSTRFDDDGNGTYDREQTVSVTVAADNSRTKVISNFSADGSLSNRTTTITSADKRTITALSDVDGDGLVDERQVVIANTDGSTSTIVEALSGSGTLLKRVVMDAAADGLSKTTRSDLTGGGVYHLVQTETTTVAGDGSRTRTVTKVSSGGMLLSKLVEVSSANGQLKTVDVDSDGDGRFDERQVITTEVGEGFYTTTTEILNEDGTLRSKASSFTNLDGKQKSAQFDLDGDGVFESRTSETSWENNGFRNESVSRRGPGDKYSSTSMVGPGGATRLLVEDSNGDGKPDRRVQVLSSAQQTTTSTQVFNRAGTVIASESITASNDGSRVSSSADRDGDGVFEASVEQTTTTGDSGEQITEITHLSGFSSARGLSGSTIRTVSADGLTTVIHTDIDGNGGYERSTREANVLNQDGSRTKRTTVHSSQGLKLSGSETTVSADRKTLTVLEDVDGDDQTDLQKISISHADGSQSLVSTLIAAGSTIERTLTTRSADGLNFTTEVDADGNGSIDLKTIEEIRINGDGSRVQELAQFAGNGKLISKSTAETSGNGLKSESNTDRNGDGVIDLRGSDITVLNANGSRTRTISSSVDGSIATTISASGFVKTTVIDKDGDGSAERNISDETVIAGDLSVTNTVSTTSASGQLLSKTTTITASDRNTSSVSVDTDGDGLDDRILSAQVEMSGATTTTSSTFIKTGAQSTLASRVTSTVSASGLSRTQLVDLDGDGSVDRKMEIAKTLQSDGSLEERVTEYGAGGTRTSETVTRVLRGGAERITAWRNDGTTISRQATESRVYSDDGSVIDTVAIHKGDGALESKTTKSVSGNTRTTTISRDIDGDGIVDHLAKSSLQGNGSLVETYDNLAADGIGLGARKTVTTGANGFVKTTEFDSNGDGQAEQRFQSTTTLRPDGGKTETITEYGTNLVARAGSVTSVSGDGLLVEQKWDVNGDGAFESSRTRAVQLNVDSSSAETVSHFTGYSLTARYQSTSSANGLAKTKHWDVNGDGLIDENTSETTTLNLDGTTTQSIQSFEAGTLLSSSTTTTSSDGLTTTTQEKRSHASDSSDRSLRSSKTVLADGTVVEARTVFNALGQLREWQKTTVSGNGRELKIERDADGDGDIDQIEARNRAIDGSSKTTITDFIRGGTNAAVTTISVAADGRSTITEWDQDGDGIIERRRLLTESFNGDGSYQGVAVDTKVASNVVASRTITKVTADGRTRVTTRDLNGDGTIDVNEVSATDVSGSTRVTTTNNTEARNARYLREGDVFWSPAIAAKIELTVASDGLSRTMRSDYDGDGIFEHIATSRTQIDGAVTTSITERDANGMVVAKGVSAVTADGMTTTLKKDSNNDGQDDRVEVGVRRADGSVRWTLAERNTNGTLNQTTVSEINSLGNPTLSVVTDGQGRKVSERVFEADGSFTVRGFDGPSGSLLLISAFGTNGIPVSTVLLDPLNQQLWSRIEQTFDAAGVKTFEKQFNGDATTQEHRFRPDTGKLKDIQVFAIDGSLTSQTLYDAQELKTNTVLFDPLNQNPWSRVEQSFDADGAKLVEKQLNDDGSTQELRLNPSTGNLTDVQTFTANGALTSKTLFDAQGKAASTTLYDPLNQQSWSRVEQSFDTNGVKTLEKQYNDDGTRTDIFYRPPSGKPYEAQNFASNGTLLSKTFYDTAGIKTSAVIYDPFSENAWSRVEQNFDAAGVKTIEKQFNDNGTRVEVFYRSPSGRQYESQSFGADGNLDSKTFYDAAGVRTSAVVYDPRNVQPWSRAEQTFDAVGVKTVEKQFADDGTRVELFYRSPSGVIYETQNYTTSGGLLSKTFFDTTGKKTSAIVYDVTNQNVWSRVEQTFDAAGVKTLEKQFQDNGTRTDLYYRAPGGQLYEVQVFSTSGVLTSKTEYDTAANQPWSRREHLFDAQGRTTQSATFNDDGSKRIDHIDVANAQSWSTSASYYNAAGTLYFVDQRNDNGTRNTVNYDADNNQGWSRYEQLRDSADRVLNQANFNDDGSRSTFAFDPTNAQTWSTYHQNYNAAGQLFSVDQTNDDGSHNTVHYDVANNQGWARYEQYIDGSGRLLSQVNYNDDGSRHAYSFDPANTQTWAKITQVYNGAGALEWQANEFDNGTIETTTYNVNNNKPWAHFIQMKNAGGALTWEASVQSDKSKYVKFWDAANGEAWSQLEQYVDAAGNLTAQFKRFDNGTVEELRFNGQATARQLATFDANYYLAMNPDIANGWHAPAIDHYNQFGWKEGRRPNAWFDGNYYLQQNADVRNAGLNPFEHWRANGYAEGRSPHAGYQRFDGRAQSDLAALNEPLFAGLQRDRIGEMRSYARNTYNLIDRDNDRSRPRYPPNVTSTLRNVGWNYDDRAVLSMYPQYVANRFGMVSKPVILDLDGDNHIDLRMFSPAEFEAGNGPRFDWDSDGIADGTAWVGPNDGWLTIDLAADGSAGPDGMINQAKELAFTLWKTGDELAQEQADITDLEALRLVFDTNGNNQLDAGDTRWSEFRVWRDTNQNGVSEAGELRTLAEADISLIGLVPSAAGARDFADGSAITGTSSYLKGNGTTALVGDVKVTTRPSSFELGTA